jgi:REP element-mobilizing transposase RayT
MGAQRELVFRTWGGARDGAGRKPLGVRAGRPHVARPALRPAHPVHVTLRVVDGVGGLRCKAMYGAIDAATRAVAGRADFRIVHTSIQRDHLHALAEASSADALSRGVRAFQISAARHINKLQSRRGRVFADRYHARILTTPKAVRIALHYVLNNWRKHAEDRRLPFSRWPVDLYSTGLGFTGWSDLPTWTAPASYQPLHTRAPATWLLTTGWRRAGAISVHGVPGA